MIEIFRDRSPVKVGYYKSILDEKGIATFMRNDNLSAVEAPIPAFYPAFCIMNEKDLKLSLRILEEIITAEKKQSKLPDKPCLKCSELNPANFETCWSCGNELSTNISYM